MISVAFAQSPTSSLPWRCPRCHAALARSGDAIECTGCSARYEVVDGIPDFRISTNFWLDADRDRAIAREVAARFAANHDITDLLRQVFSSGLDQDAARAAIRAQQVLEAPERLRKELDGWLEPTVREDAFLDLGCGPGMFLAAAALRGRAGIGIDASLAWLVVAKHLIAQSGGRPVLAAALTDALPLADRSMSASIALDVIEHVADPAALLREMNRVTRVGGSIALSTPNRFSMAAEPHVALWGVGWVPRPWQADFVRWRSGKSYTYTCLLSTWEAAGMMRRETDFDFRILVPEISAEEIRRFPAYRRLLARTYNRLSAVPLLRGLFLIICPFFRILGARRAPS